MIKPNATSRSRRLRKKLHVDEFQELCFHYSVTFKERPQGDEQEEAFIDALIDQVIARGLDLAGWIDEGIIARNIGSATDEDRAVIEAWLRQRPEVASVTIGPLVDAWYIAEDEAVPAT